jgi:HPt (histidine-containing phosphotransfer) domain-containing protein
MAVMSSFVAETNNSTVRRLDLDSLTKRCLGRVDLAYRVLEKFNSSVGNDMALLEQAIVARNLTEVARVAHRVKGASLSVSACSLAEHSHRLECRALNLPSDAEQRLSDGLESLDVLWSELRTEFFNVAELATSKSGSFDTNE